MDSFASDIQYACASARPHPHNELTFLLWSWRARQWNVKLATARCWYKASHRWHVTELTRYPRGRCRWPPHAVVKTIRTVSVFPLLPSGAAPGSLCSLVPSTCQVVSPALPCSLYYILWSLEVCHSLGSLPFAWTINAASIITSKQNKIWLIVLNTAYKLLGIRY